MFRLNQDPHNCVYSLITYRSLGTATAGTAALRCLLGRTALLSFDKHNRIITSHFNSYRSGHYGVTISNCKSHLLTHNPPFLFTSLDNNPYNVIKLSNEYVKYNLTRRLLVRTT